MVAAIIAIVVNVRSIGTRARSARRLCVVTEPNAMLVPNPTTEAGAVILADRVPKVALFKQVIKNPVGLATVILLAVVALASIFAPMLTSQDPNFASIRDVLKPATEGHPLGFDSAGRDVWARLVFAGRFSLTGALLALGIAAALGVTSGLIAGYYQGWFASFWTWLSSLVQAIPGIVLLLAARAVIGPSMWMAMTIFGVLLMPAFYRLTYAAVTAVRNELYVDAARVSGLSDARIIARHILTVVRAPVIIQAAMIMGIAIAIQSGLEFLGLGDPSIPTWGTMLQDGFTNIYTRSDLVLWPSLVIAVVCVSLTLLANTMRDALERSVQPTRKRKKSATKRQDPDKVAVLVHQDDQRSAGRNAEVLLQVTDLSVGYHEPRGGVNIVVHDVSLTVRRGEVHGLIGESGSGKTQTAFAVMQLLPAGGHVVGGSILFEGKDLADASEKQMEDIRGSKIAYIPQEPMSNLDPAFTIGSQLVEPMRLNLGISKLQATTKALGLLAHVGISNPKRVFDSYPHQLSGGMAQRVLIAGAVSCEPDLLIADEPTTALDVTIQAEVLDLLRNLQAEMNMGMILVTHNFGVVADICDRVSVMRNGRVIETGPVRSIFYNAQHPYTQSLLGAILDEGEPRGPLLAPPAAVGVGS
jgi:peptide/nickel transport system permease protein